MNMNAANTPQWSVTNGATTNNAMDVNFVHQPNHWTSVKVGYWASTRPDITLGSYAASNSLFNLGLNLRAATQAVVITFDNPAANPQNAVGRAFITGWTRTSGSQVAIRSYVDGIISTAIQTFVQVVGDMSITNVQINYIVFNPRTVNFS